MPSLKDINAYTKYPKEKMHTIRVHLFFAFLLFFILIGLRSVLILNVKAVYHEMGENSFYIQISQDNQEERMDKLMHNLYDDVTKSTFTTEMIIIDSQNTNTSEIMHSNDVSNFYFREFYCHIDLFEEKPDGVIIYDKLAEELFGYSDERVLSQKIKFRMRDLSTFVNDYEFEICGTYHLKEIDTIFTTNKYMAADTIFHYTDKEYEYSGTRYVKYTSSHINSNGEIEKINRLFENEGLPRSYDSYFYNTEMHLKTCDMINMIIDFCFTFTFLIITIKIIILYFLKYDQDVNIFKVRANLGESSPHLFLFLFLSQIRTFVPPMLIGFAISMFFKIMIEAFTYLFFPDFLTYFICLLAIFLLYTIILAITSLITTLLLNRNK